MDPIERMPDLVDRDMDRQARDERRGQVSTFTCPECGSEKGVIAATHYDDVMGFCPSCEQVWGCDVSLS